MPRCDVLVIGAGVAGLTTALALSREGLRVLVLEATPQVGGRARSWVDLGSGDVIDIGPHILLTEYCNFLNLLEALGTRSQVCWNTCRFVRLVDGRTRVDVRLARLPPPLHMLPAFMQAPLSWREALSNLRPLRLALATDEDLVEALDACSALEVLQAHGASPRAIDWFWRSACMAIMNVPLEQCSAGALLRFYGVMAGLNDYTSGFATCGLSELYALPAVAAIARAGGSVLTGTPAAQLDSAATGLVVRLADGSAVHAPQCVLAVPPQAIAALVPPAWCEAHACFGDAGGFHPSAYICTHLWFAERLTTEKFWSLTWKPDTLNYDFYDLCNIREGWNARAGSVIASNIMYADRAGAMDDAAVVRATREELAQFVPAACRAVLRHAHVERVPMGIPCPFPGTERKRPATRTPVPHLYLAGDWTRTGLPASMESAARSGWLAAEAVLADLGRPRRLAKMPRARMGPAAWLQAFARRRRTRSPAAAATAAATAHRPDRDPGSSFAHAQGWAQRESSTAQSGDVPAAGGRTGNR